MDQALQRLVDVRAVNKCLNANCGKQARNEAGVSKRAARGCAFRCHYLDERKCIRNAEGKNPVSEGADPPGASILCHCGGEGKHVAYSFFSLKLLDAFFV